MGHRPAVPAPRRALRVVLLGLAAVLLLLTGGAPAAAQTPPPTPAATASPTGAPTAEEAGEAVRGTLNNAGARVPDVRITVEQDGEVVAEGVTDAQGAFLIELPNGPGAYTVVIDQDTLPEGVAVREVEGGEPGQREVTVREGQTAPALLPLGEDTRQEASRADRFYNLLVGGVQFGLVIAMAAIGLSLIFGTTGLTNFAHGELVTGGAMLAYVFNVLLGLDLVIATLLAVGGAGVLGFLLDKGLWGPLRRRGTGLIAALVVSIGLSLVLRYLYLYFFGGGPRPYDQYVIQDPIVLGPVAIVPRDLFIIVISAVVLVAVGIALQRTKLGKATRAVADNPALASSSGIDVERVINVVWAAGTALAALGGVFLALSQNVGFLLGFNILLLLFAGVTLGGLGTAFGALVGSLVIGVFTQVSTLFIDAELQNVGALIILIVVLVVRPQGILGRRERVG